MLSGYIAVFLIGLAGGAHCVGMCGGIVSALSLQTQGPSSLLKQLPIHLAYNLGRICTYTAAGVLLGSVGLLYRNVLPVQLALYVLANVMLILLGLYLTGFTALLAPVERLGGRLWKRIQPVTTRFLPVRSVRQAFPLGLLWGFLPCGLVYSVLATALVTGSALRGGALMLAFGLGTLPNLLLAGVLLRRFRDFARHRAVRMVAGLVVIGFGIYGLLHVRTLGGNLWNGVLCVT